MVWKHPVVLRIWVAQFLVMNVDALLSGPRRALPIGLSPVPEHRLRTVAQTDGCLRTSKWVSARAQVRARKVPKQVANSM